MRDVHFLHAMLGNVLVVRLIQGVASQTIRLGLLNLVHRKEVKDGLVFCQRDILSCIWVQIIVLPM